MKINEILIESKEQLEEGPILNKIGSAIGKGVGTLAKGVGAVAGGIAGVGSAVKKGFQAGKGVVGAAGDGAAAPAAGGGGAAAPAAPAAPAASGAPPSAQDINAQGPAGTAPAKAQTGAAGAALAKTTAAVDQQTTDKAGQTVYAQVKANIDKLDKKGKQRILQLLQKSVTAPAAKPAAAAAAPAAAAPAAAEPAADPAGAGAMGQMAGQLAKGGAAPNTMANAPVSKTNTAKPGNPNAAPAAEPAAAPAPSGEKTIANPVATVGTKRAANIGKPTFDTQTGKSLPGQALNNVRKKAEYGTNALGAARKKIKAGAAQPEMASKINTGSLVLEGFSLFRKK